MNLKVKFIVVVLLTPLFIACSKSPTDEEVTAIIAHQLEQSNSVLNNAVANTSDTEAVAAMQKMIPKLKGVDKVDCDKTDGENTYICTARVIQTINGEERVDNAKFNVQQVNNEWVLGE